MLTPGEKVAMETVLTSRDVRPTTRPKTRGTALPRAAVRRAATRTALICAEGGVSVVKVRAGLSQRPKVMSEFSRVMVEPSALLSAAAAMALARAVSEP